MPKPSISRPKFHADAKERVELIAPTLVREQFRQAARTDWTNYGKTGLHLTGEEVDAWLAKLAAGKDDNPPKCHV